MVKTYAEINQKIENGDAVVVTAEEMIDIVEQRGLTVAAEDVDVVTTGTFGAMCSSGAFLNFGHTDPPIKFEHLWLNGVHAYHGNAAVDCYIGCTRMSESRPFEYGGGHVIEDLVAGKPIHLTGNSYTTDCYPKESVDTYFTIDEMNQAILCNPRNGYQRYVCAVNSSDNIMYTYMGKLLPNLGNATFSGAGCLSPLAKDPNFETIGMGTRIFLGGGIGYVIGEGTQHSPTNQFGTVFLKGDLKQMKPEYLRGATFTKYGTSMYVGFGIPIPVLNEGIAKVVSAKDEDLITDVLDYGVARRSRPNLRRINYKELKSGTIDLNGKRIKVAPLSSISTARKIAGELKDWIQKGKFFLNPPAETLSTDRIFKPMKEVKAQKFVKDFKKVAIVCKLSDSVHDVAQKIIRENENHVAIIDDNDILVGIVTSFDITKAVAGGKENLSEIITKKVFTTTDDEPVDVAARRMRSNNINGLPVIDRNKKVIGLITSEELLLK